MLRALGLLAPFAFVGCIPMGYAASLSALGTTGTQSISAVQEGAELSGRVHAQGSRGLTLAGDVDLARPDASRACCILGRASLGAGYAYAPRPFEGRLGWEALGRAGVGSVTPHNEPRFALLAAARLALLVRLTGDTSVWAQDRAPSRPVWYLAPFADASPLFPTSALPVSLEATLGLGLRASFYDPLAP
jgi:hypothetical protein